MACEYCAGLAVVGGSLPDRSRRASPCQYCDEADSPMTAYWMSEVMWPVPFDPRHTAFTHWIEPELQGTRVIAVLLEGKEHNWVGWHSKHKLLPPDSATTDLREQLCELHRILAFNGERDWMLGAAFDGVLLDGVLTLVHALPLVPLLDGQDSSPHSVRRLELEEAFGEGLLRSPTLRLVPKVRLNTGARITASLLSEACQSFNTSAAILKDADARWTKGPSIAWQRYDDNDL